MYVRYADGFEEAYDERADPFELDNVFVTDPADPQLPLLRAAASRYCTKQDGRIYPDGWPFQSTPRPGATISALSERSTPLSKDGTMPMKAAWMHRTSPKSA